MFRCPLSSAAAAIALFALAGCVPGTLGASSPEVTPAPATAPPAPEPVFPVSPGPTPAPSPSAPPAGSPDEASCGSPDAPACASPGGSAEAAFPAVLGAAGSPGPLEPAGLPPDVSSTSTASSAPASPGAAAVAPSAAGGEPPTAPSPPTGSVPLAEPMGVEQVVTGRILSGTEPGCRVLRVPDRDREFLLIVEPGESGLAPVGGQVTVTGWVQADLMTICTRGVPLVVSRIRPS